MPDAVTKGQPPPTMQNLVIGIDAHGMRHELVARHLNINRELLDAMSTTKHAALRARWPSSPVRRAASAGRLRPCWPRKGRT